MPWWDPRGELRAQLLVLLRRGRHRVLDLCARGADAAGMAAAGLCRRRPLFGVVTSVLRMAFGGHFFTDVAAAGLVTFLVIWLAYAWIYRWPSTRLSDERIDAALTRLAWPGYRLRQRWRGRDGGSVRSLPAAIKRVPIAREI